MDSPDIQAAETETPQTFTIQPEAVGQRLDRYLLTLIDGLSRTAVQTLISEEAILINGRASKAGYPLRANDEVQVLRTQRPHVTAITPQILPLTILYEDKDLLIIDKEAGMVVHPAPGHREDTLVNALLAARPELQGVGSDERPGIVHRLDKETSGLLIVAKNTRALAALREQMENHLIVKRYLALVDGQMPLDQGSIDAPIGRDPSNRQQMAVTSQHSREARTHFKVQERFERHTLLLLELETGRTHQIRVHLKAIGHPITGDPVYGAQARRRGSAPELKRPFLHAYQLRFTHPVTGVKMEFESALPEELQSVLRAKKFL